MKCLLKTTDWSKNYAPWCKVYILKSDKGGYFFTDKENATIFTSQDDVNNVRKDIDFLIVENIN